MRYGTSHNYLADNTLRHYVTKGRVLQCKTRPFTLQKVTFCSMKDHILETQRKAAIDFLTKWAAIISVITAFYLSLPMIRNTFTTRAWPCKTDYTK